MAELRGVSLGQHLQAIVSELESSKSIYGYRQRDIFTGDPEHDFSVDFHGKRTYTQLGPASGPHTQLTQNIILAFLGGSRCKEKFDLPNIRPWISSRMLSAGTGPH